MVAAATSRATRRIALRTSVVVGTLLNLVNHAEALCTDWPSVGVAPLALNYAIPYAVATWAAASAVDRQDGAR
ncbi:MAG: hypothetical protein ACOC97_01405 [Myxococcota bacterium]